jgi:hypothetical protein
VAAHNKFLTTALYGNDVRHSVTIPASSVHT